MCYYNGQRVSHDEYIRLKELEKAAAAYDFLDKDLIPGFTYGNIAALRPNADKTNFDIVEMEWGFLPSYIKTRADAKKMREGYKDVSGQFHPPITTLNAVGEELLLIDPKTGREKMYRQAALHRRCLVLSSGFYEWRHIAGINKRTGLPLKTANKYPYRIGVKDVPYFYMAGIWQDWTDRETGEVAPTVAIVTTAANNLMRQVHNSKMRMPTILPDHLAWEWMMEDLTEEQITEIATFRYDPSAMDAYTIDKDFRQSASPTSPQQYEEVPELVS